MRNCPFVVVLVVSAVSCGGSEAGSETVDGTGETSASEGDGDGDGDGDAGCVDPFEPRPTPALDLTDWVDGEMQVDAPCEVMAVLPGDEGLTTIVLDCPFENTRGTIRLSVVGSPAIISAQVVTATGSCEYVGGDAEGLRPRGYAWHLALRDQQGGLLVAAADGGVPASAFDPLAMALVAACGQPTELEDVRAALEVSAAGEEALLLFPGDTQVIAGHEVHLHRAELFGCCEVSSWMAVTVLPE